MRLDDCNIFGYFYFAELCWYLSCWQTSLPAWLITSSSLLGSFTEDDSTDTSPTTTSLYSELLFKVRGPIYIQKVRILETWDVRLITLTKFKFQSWNLQYTWPWVDNFESDYFPIVYKMLNVFKEKIFKLSFPFLISLQF